MLAYARTQPACADLAPPPPLAVILNRHARGVSPRVLRHIVQNVPRRDLYLSRSARDSDRIASTVVERGYRTVLLGGGDGTFVRCLDDLRGHARRRGSALPSIGVLRLGTGNALATALAASEANEEGLRRDLKRALDPAHVGTLPLLEVDGVLTPFAGIGLDAQIQSDFAAVTRALDGLGVGRSLGAGVRYALAVGLLSTPRYLVTRFPEVIAVNRGAPAWRLGPGGRPVGEPVPAGAVLYRGRCSIATGSSIPYFGLGMKAFPHAQAAPGRFQLRCAGVSALELLSHLPALWRGEYYSDAIGDFLVEKVELRAERPVPFQIGGDLQDGLRDRVVLGMARPITVVQ